MGFSKQDLLTVAKLIRRDMGMAQGKLTDLIENIAKLPDEDPSPTYRCPHCGPLASVQNERQLAEHMENVHGRTPLLTNERSKQ